MFSLKKSLESRGYIAHPIRLSEKSGHIITKASINGHTGRFIIDTGASATCINNALSHEFQLESESMNKQIGTASGSLTPQISHNNKMQLGAWTDEDCSLLTMDMSFINQALKAERMRAIQGLLGADFLIKSRAIIDYSGKNIYLKNIP
ncbi:MAG: retropepsin-like aspartic protease [Nonlabens sp.]|uniref:retropepsin-like aspartic protease n=1 Tax=Nonlabens sp. TaxID=1888209 RepID=UPI003EF1C607